MVIHFYPEIIGIYTLWYLICITWHVYMCIFLEMRAVYYMWKRRRLPCLKFSGCSIHVVFLLSTAILSTMWGSVSMVLKSACVTSANQIWEELILLNGCSEHRITKKTVKRVKGNQMEGHMEKATVKWKCEGQK